MVSPLIGGYGNSSPAGVESRTPPPGAPKGPAGAPTLEHEKNPREFWADNKLQPPPGGRQGRGPGARGGGGGGRCTRQPPARLRRPFAPGGSVHAQPPPQPLVYTPLCAAPLGPRGPAPHGGGGKGEGEGVYTVSLPPGHLPPLESPRLTSWGRPPPPNPAPSTRTSLESPIVTLPRAPRPHPTGSGRRDMQPPCHPPAPQPPPLCIT